MKTKMNRIATTGLAIAFASASLFAAVQYSFSSDYYIKTKAGNRCLDVPNASSSNGVQLQVWDCNGSNAQKWKFGQVGLWQYRVVNVGNGKCMEVSTFGGDGNRGQGCKVIQYDFNWNNWQKWYIDGTGDWKWKKFKPVHNTNLRLDVENCGGSNWLCVWTETGCDGQKFHIPYAYQQEYSFDWFDDFTEPGTIGAIWTATNDATFAENDAVFKSSQAWIDNYWGEAVLRLQWNGHIPAGWYSDIEKLHIPVDRYYKSGELRTNWEFTYGIMKTRLYTPNVYTGYVQSMFTFRPMRASSGYGNRIWIEQDVELMGADQRLGCDVNRMSSNLIIDDHRKESFFDCYSETWNSLGIHDIPGGNHHNFHQYEMIWHPDKFEWYIDGQHRRTTYRSALGGWGWIADQSARLMINIWGSTSGVLGGTYNGQQLDARYDYVEMMKR